MRRRFILIALAVALTVNVYSQSQNRQKNSSKPSVADTLISYEKQSWEAVKQKDYKYFADHYAEDFYLTFPSSPVITKPQLPEFFGRFDLNDYQLGNIRVTMLNKSAAILTYEVDEQVTSGGKKFLNHNSITSAWVKRGNKWLNVLFQPIVLKSRAA